MVNMDEWVPLNIYDTAVQLIVRHEALIAYLVFPAWEPDCVVERVDLRLWQVEQGDADKRMALVGVEGSWKPGSSLQHSFSKYRSVRKLRKTKSFSKT